MVNVMKKKAKVWSLVPYIIVALFWIVVDIWMLTDNSIDSYDRLTTDELLITPICILIGWVIIYFIKFFIKKIKNYDLTKKQEKHIIYSQLLLCICCFFNNWFTDYFLCSPLFFSLLTIAFNFVVLFTATFLLYLISFIKLKHKKLVITFIMLLMTIYISFCNTTGLRIKTEFILFDNQRMKLVNKITSNKKFKNKDSNETIMRVPLNYLHTTVTGTVVIYNVESNHNVIAFYASSINQVIYSDGGLKSLKKQIKSKNIKSIEKLDKNWYYVIYE